MQPWTNPYPVPPAGSPAPPVRVFDSRTVALQEVAPGDTATIYTCGITPYDATHIGHANTYVAFDLLNRAWQSAGKRLVFSQNITDVDDPLLERAEKTGVAWQDLAADQIALFRGDMAALRVLPPEYWVTVSEAMTEIIEAVTQLLQQGDAYFIHHHPAADEFADVYFDISKDASFGTVANLSYSQMLELFAARGGDPEREGKHNALDPLLWRAERLGEPWWDGGVLGRGRPGWHIGCAVIARNTLGEAFDVTGGGTDLLFPHHEMSASIARALSKADSEAAMPNVGGAHYFVHTGMISYQGEKMSKSLGNLVIVSDLIAAGVDPMAIRLALLSHHYRQDWEWTSFELEKAESRLNAWRQAVAESQTDDRAALPWWLTRDIPRARPSKLPNISPNQTDVRAAQTISEITAALADDLNAPAALQAIDRHIEAGIPLTDALITQIDSLLGVAL